MSTTETTSKKPSHDVFAVEAQASGKGFWTKIGAAWAHEDGNGFSVKLGLVPVAGQSIQLRQIEARQAKAD